MKETNTTTVLGNDGSKHYNKSGCRREIQSVVRTCDSSSQRDDHHLLFREQQSVLGRLNRLNRLNGDRCRKIELVSLPARLCGEDDRTRDTAV